MKKNNDLTFYKEMDNGDVARFHDISVGNMI